MRSLSSRSTVSELTLDEDYNSSSASSSRNTSRCLESFVEHQPSAQRMTTTSLRLDKLVVVNGTEADSLNASSNGIVAQNQWNYLPQTVWKQTAEVKQINFD